MTLKEFCDRLNLQELALQKNWLAEQVAELEPTGTEATGYPEGLLNLLDNLMNMLEGENLLPGTEAVTGS